MTKDQLILLLKNYKENKAKLRLRRRERKKLNKELRKKPESETSTTTRIEINADIHSKNSISDKVYNKVAQNDEKRQENKKRLKEVEKEIEELEEKVEEAKIRLECLKYKEKEIMTAYYVDGREADEIGRNLYSKIYGRTCTTENIYRIIKKATEKILNL